MASPLPIKLISQIVSGFWNEAKHPRSGHAACVALVLTSGIAVLGTRIYVQEDGMTKRFCEEEKTERVCQDEKTKRVREEEKTKRSYNREEEKTKRSYNREEKKANRIREEEKTKRAKYWHEIYKNSAVMIANKDKGNSGSEKNKPDKDSDY